MVSSSIKTKSILLTVGALCCASAQAVDVSWSGFGTVGYAQSNRDYTYQRFINSDGTFKRDTVLGGQVDAQISPNWSATLQLQAAPSIRDDQSWRVIPSLAFVAWRLDDNWLVRAGRFRSPLFMHSETMELGNSFDTVRMPTELYAMVPLKEFDGVYVSRFWSMGDRELSLEAYHGFNSTTLRTWTGSASSTVFDDEKVNATGFTFNLRGKDSVWRAGLHKAVFTTAMPGGFTVGVPYVNVAPGVGYWQVSNLLPGPGIVMSPTASVVVATVGTEHEFGQGWRVSAELARAQQPDSRQLGAQAYGAYIALSKRVGRFTPYVSISALRSDAAQLKIYDQLSNASLPAVVPGAASIVAAQQVAANGVLAYDQRSLSIGASYELTTASKIKFEWMRTAVGVTSVLIDRPRGSTAPRNTSINVVSVSYSFSF